MQNTIIMKLGHSVDHYHINSNYNVISIPTIISTYIVIIKYI